MKQGLRAPNQPAIAGAILALLVIAGVSLTSEVATARSVARTTPGLTYQNTVEGPTHCWDFTYTFDVNAYTNSVKIWYYESDGSNPVGKSSEEVRNVSPSSGGHSYYRTLGGAGHTATIFTHAFTGTDATGDSVGTQKQFVEVVATGCPAEGAR